MGNLSSNDKVLTKEDLKAFYQAILPYLGSGSKEALNFDDLTNKPEAIKTFTPSILPNIAGGKLYSYDPIGTVIAFMGTTAPENYLICDGSVLNIADYSNLANFFEDQFGSKNYFGGDGTTTFAVPDLQGEFLRGSGTNSHANQGSGTDVGVHQDGTEHLGLRGDGHPQIFYATEHADGKPYFDDTNKDFIRTATKGCYTRPSMTAYTEDLAATYTSRPTNTSVLYCIKYKTDEKYQIIYDDKERIIGEWFGKPLYQKTYEITFTNPKYNQSIPHNLTNFKLVSAECYGTNDNETIIFPLPQTWISKVGGSGPNNGYGVSSFYVFDDNIIIRVMDGEMSEATKAFVTLRYTKTTD